jgi:hypothetical protein
VLTVNQTATKTLITEAFHVERSNKHKLLGGTRVGWEGRRRRQAAHITVDSLIPVPNLLSFL